MADGDRRKVSVAHVTKWATTRGIEVVRDVERSDMFPDHLRWRGGLIIPKHWTTDKAEAEKRYAAALAKREKELVRNLKAIRQAISDGPRYTEES